MMELDCAPIDDGTLLYFLELLELDDQCLDHGLGRVDLVVVPGLAKGGLDDIA